MPFLPKALSHTRNRIDISNRVRVLVLNLGSAAAASVLCDGAIAIDINDLLAGDSLNNSLAVNLDNALKHGDAAQRLAVLSLDHLGAGLDLDGDETGVKGGGKADRIFWVGSVQEIGVGDDSSLDLNGRDAERQGNTIEEELVANKRNSESIICRI